MAQINWGIGLAAFVETTPGTPMVFATDATLTISGTQAATGIVLGDSASGVGESGISFALDRVDKDVAPVSSSFTAQFPSFVRREIGTLSIAVQGKGSGRNATATPVASDFNLATHYVGLDALLKSAGLTGAAVAATHSYTPASASPITVKLWVGSGATTVLYILTNCVSVLTLNCTPGDVAVWTFDITGTVDSISTTVTMSTFTYGTAASVSAPVVQEANHSLGLTGGMTARGFSDLAIVLNNEIEEIPDSNQKGGVAKRQTGRVVTAAMTLFSDNANEGYEDSLLASTTATTDDVIFRVGLATAGSAPAIDWNVVLANPVVKKNEVAKLGPSVARAVELQATSDVANGEFQLNFY